MPLLDKTINRILASALCAVTLLFSCTPEQEKMENAVSFGADSVGSHVTGHFITITSSENWNISLLFPDGTAVWATVSPSEGSGSANNVMLLYDRNTSESSRKVEIKVLFASGETISGVFTQGGVNGGGDDPGPDDPSDPEQRWLELPGIEEDNDQTMFVTHRTELSGMDVRNYSMCYDKENRIALWVAYPISDLYLGGVGRSEAWGYDPKIPSEYQPDLSKGWPDRDYDRGHQLPSGSRTATRSENAQTFYYTNMTAQFDSFNQGLWANSEVMVRGFASTCDTLYVVTGPLLTTAADKSIDYTEDRSGNKVALPKAYFKVLLKYNLSSETFHSIGFYFENRKYDRSDPVQSDLYRVSEIEEMTGISFFTNLPDEIEQQVKNQYEPSRWGFN